MTPYNALKTLGLIAEELKAEHGLDEDGKPLSKGKVAESQKNYESGMTPEQAEAIFRD